MVAIAFLLAQMSTVLPAGDDDADPVPPIVVKVSDAGTTLVIPAVIQQQAGLEFLRLEKTEMLPERTIQGQVVDVAPLLELRRQHSEARSEVDAARAAQARAQAALQRLQTLSRDPADVSARRLAEAETARDDATLRLRSATARESATRDALRLAWGEQLAGRVQVEPGQDDRFFEGQVLLLMMAEAGADLEPGTRIVVSMSGDRSAAVPAEAIGPAPMAAAVAGAAWYFSAPSADFRTGAHVQGWMPTTPNPISGVLVPGSAVVWHGGAPWAYWRMDATHFARLNLAGAVEVGGGRFIAETAYSGREIVVRGAQTLLSEEQRAQIPDEDDDP